MKRFSLAMGLLTAILVLTLSGCSDLVTGSINGWLSSPGNNTDVEKEKEKEKEPVADDITDGDNIPDDDDDTPPDTVIVIRSIAVQQPAKTQYVAGQAFSTDGMKILADTETGEMDVDEGYTLSWEGNTIQNGNTAITAEPGDKTVTVAYQEHTDDFQITVTPIVSSNKYSITNMAEWEDALGQLKSGTEGSENVYEFTLNDAVSVPASAIDQFKEHIEIRLLGEGTLALSSQQGSLLRTVTSNQTWVVDSPDLVLQGAPDNESPLITVYNGGVELRQGKIVGNAKGGVKVGANGTFVMGEGAVITGNPANAASGLAVDIDNKGTFVMDGGGILGNDPAGAVYVGEGGTFTMNDGGIYNTSATASCAVKVEKGAFTMNGGALGGLTATNAYAVTVDGETGTFTMTEGIMANNYGGVHIINGGAFIMKAGEISNNEYTAVKVTKGTFTLDGGTLSGVQSGVNLSGTNTAATFTMTGGAISATDSPGVYINGGTFTMGGGRISDSRTGVHLESWGGNFVMKEGATITGNSAFGVSLYQGSFTMDGGTISANDIGVNSGMYGTFTMNGGTISDNTAEGVVNGYVTMDGGTISNNGRGVKFSDEGSFTMKKGTISGNTAEGVYLTGGYVSFNMKAGTVSGNGDSGVKVENCYFTMEGGTISGNKRSGVYVEGIGGSFRMDGGVIEGNVNDEKGGGVYFKTSSGSFNMTAGTIRDNKAWIGGGVYFQRQFSSTEYQGFKKTGGTIYGDDPAGNTYTAGTNHNTAISNEGISTNGHAVVYFESSGDKMYYHNETLGTEADGNIWSYGTMPFASGDTLNKWTKK